MDINPTPRYNRAMDPDMALGSTLSPVDTMAPGQAAQVTQISMSPAVAHPLDPNVTTSCDPKLRHPLCPLVTTQVMDINTNPSCNGIIDTDMVPRSSQGPDGTTAWDAAEGPQIDITPAAG